MRVYVSRDGVVPTQVEKEERRQAVPRPDQGPEAGRRGLTGRPGAVDRKVLYGLSTP